ncbi:MAG: right-handed parallel beta-helix repeat-containing protein [Paludibacter sp.]
MVNYYISNTGNDATNGKSIETAWKSIERVNQANLEPGDQLLFECGQRFEGELKIKNSGTKAQPTVISSYGNGAKPVITGAICPSNFISLNNGIYVADMPQKVFQLFADDQLKDLARIPTKGFYSIENGDKRNLIDNQHLNLPYNLTVATVRIRAVNWQYETALVSAHDGGKITFTENMMYQCNPRYGYLLDNKLEFLTEEGQWFWDEKTNKLFVKTENTIPPELVKIEAVISKNGITIAENVSHISISNLQIEKYENAAILGLGKSSNISISDCNINNINVYGICLEINSGNYSITNNTISDIRGRGISTLESSNNEITHNTVLRCGMEPGYGFDGVNNGIGIAVLKTEVVYKISAATYGEIVKWNIPLDYLDKIKKQVNLPYPDEKFVIEALELSLGKIVSEIYIYQIMPFVNAEAKAQKLESTNNRIAYNVVDESGYAGIRLDGNNSIAEYNVIKNSLLHMNDGGALYCWAQNEDYTHHNIFRNNIIINAVGSCVATANDLAYAYGIYTDNKCHHITIENNTVVGTVGGILINDEAHHQNITGNTLYNNTMGLVFSEYFMPDSLVGCEAYNNILFAKKRDQRALFVECRIRENFVPGLLDKNLYANPYYPFPIVALTYKDNVRSFKEYTLESWQKHYGQDGASKTIATANHDAGGQQSHIFINETKELKSFDVPTDLIYTDLDGNILKDKIEVAPFSSVIILQK